VDEVQDKDVADIDPLNSSTATAEGLPKRRSASRDSLFLSATIRPLEQPDADVLPVRVRNLSSVGMMADYHGTSLPGEAVVVALRGIGQVKGKVAWVRNNRIGIAFDVEVDPKLARKPVKAEPEAPSGPLKLF
jgi:hypothetical protein